MLENKKGFGRMKVQKIKSKETIVWKELDLEQMERDENAYADLRSSEEVEQIVVMVRMELYNQGLPCGPRALRRRLDEHEVLRPLPSERTIARILARNGLTCGRNWLV